mmetsp:Transcript_26989/g.48691  ORF Transcript_26989/g.48691 Transcript_26989/m.48691 type:complete len:234 (+) Transcript_26989:1583-2284(+)
MTIAGSHNIHLILISPSYSLTSLLPRLDQTPSQDIPPLPPPRIIHIWILSIQRSPPHPIPNCTLGNHIAPRLQQRRTERTPGEFGNAHLPHNGTLLGIPRPLIEGLDVPPKRLGLARISTCQYFIVRGIIAEQGRLACHDGHFGKWKVELRAAAGGDQFGGMAVGWHGERHGWMGDVVGKDLGGGLGEGCEGRESVFGSVRFPFLGEEGWCRRGRRGRWIDRHGERRREWRRC